MKNILLILFLFAFSNSFAQIMGARTYPNAEPPGKSYFVIADTTRYYGNGVARTPNYKISVDSAKKLFASDPIDCPIRRVIDTVESCVEDLTLRANNDGDVVIQPNDYKNVGIGMYNPSAKLDLTLNDTTGNPLLFQMTNPYGQLFSQNTSGSNLSGRWGDNDGQGNGTTYFYDDKTKTIGLGADTTYAQNIVKLLRYIGGGTRYLTVNDKGIVDTTSFTGSSGIDSSICNPKVKVDTIDNCGPSFVERWNGQTFSYAFDAGGGYLGVGLGDWDGRGNATNIYIDDGAGHVSLYGINGVVISDLAGSGSRAIGVDNAGRLVPVSTTVTAPLTATWVGFGSGSNALTGSTDMTYTTPAGVPKLSVLNGSQIGIIQTGQLGLYNSTHFGALSFTGGSNANITFNQPLTFPTVSGSSGNVLTTNGGGILSWASGSHVDTSFCNAKIKTDSLTSCSPLIIKSPTSISLFAPTFNINGSPAASSSSTNTFTNKSGNISQWTNDANYVVNTRAINTTSPLTGGGNLNADRTIAIPAATTSVNGYLTSTDWNTFNGKSTVIPAALTKTDDTNVTLTLGGTPATALLQAASITAGWTGTLSPTRGGTGQNASAFTGVGQWSGGTYSAATALANGTTATTQTAGDNSTKVATTAGLNWGLISTITASSSATVDFTGLSAAYAAYVIMFNQVVPQTNSTAFQMRVGTGGTPTYQTGSVYSYSTIYSLLTTGTTCTANAFGTAGDTKLVVATIGNGAQSDCSGEVYIYNPSQTTLYHAMKVSLSNRDGQATPNTIDLQQAQYYLATTAITAIRFFQSSGNINSGVFKLYGIKN